MPGLDNNIFKRRQPNQQSCYMACVSQRIASTVPQSRNEWPGNAWHPKHSTYGLEQSLAMPTLAARQEKKDN